MSDVYDTDKGDWTKNATNTEETGQAAVEDGVDVGPAGNLVSEDEVGKANQTHSQAFCQEELHYKSKSQKSEEVHILNNDTKNFEICSIQLVM